MFGFGNTAKTHLQEAIVAAIKKSQAVIEFNLDGTIITANENFLGAVGYSIEKVREYTTSTAAAVEEQSAVANEMSVNTQRATASAADLA